MGRDMPVDNLWRTLWASQISQLALPTACVAPLDVQEVKELQDTAGHAVSSPGTVRWQKKSKSRTMPGAFLLILMS